MLKINENQFKKMESAVPSTVAPTFRPTFDEFKYFREYIHTLEQKKISFALVSMYLLNAQIPMIYDFNELYAPHVKSHVIIPLS